MAFEDAGWLLGEIEEIRDDLRDNELTGYYLTNGTNVLATAAATITTNLDTLSLLSGFVSKYSGNVTLSITIVNNTSRSCNARVVVKNASGVEIQFTPSTMSGNATYTGTAVIALESDSPWQVYGYSTSTSSGGSVNTTVTWSIKGTVNKFENPVMVTV